MKVLIVAAFFEPLYGGGERQLRYLCDKLVSLDHSIELLTLGIPQTPNIDKKQGITIRRFGKINDPFDIERGYFLIYQYIYKEGAFDIAYFIPNPQLPIDSQADILKLLHKLTIPIIVRVSSSGRAVQFCMSSERAHHYYLHAQKYLCLNSDIVRELTSLNISFNKMLRIRNGVDIDRFKPIYTKQRESLRSRYFFDKYDTVFITASRPAKKKKLDHLIDFWKFLETSNFINPSRHKLLIISNKGFVYNDVISISEIEAKIKMSRTKSITLISDFDNNRINDWYSVADAYISFSQKEGMSNSCLEALSSGLPIIIPNSPCYDQFINIDKVCHAFKDLNEAKNIVVAQTEIDYSKRLQLSQYIREKAYEFNKEDTLIPIIDVMFELST